MKKIFCLWLFCIGSCAVQAQKKYLIYKTDDGYDVSPKAHHNYVHKAQPFHFGYNIKDAKGNSHYHKEESDEHNYRKGSYGYTDVHGIYRQVDYIADHQGFRAKVRTNEPGTTNEHPAHVYMNAEEPPHHLQNLHQEYIKPTLKYHAQDKAQHYQQELDHEYIKPALKYHAQDKAQNYQQELHHEYIKPALKYHTQDKAQHYQQEPEQYQQEEFYQNQKQHEYEDYQPNAKERVAFVPIYAPYGNSKADEYHKQ